MMRRMAATDPALLDTAVALLREAGELTLGWFRSTDLAIERKGDGTPVTEADKAAERFLREQIAARFPDDSIVGEEEDDVVGIERSTLDHRPHRRHQGLHPRRAALHQPAGRRGRARARPSA